MDIFKTPTIRSQIILGIFTGVYFAFIYIFFYEKILKIECLELDQLGSFLGGVFAPILFLYITVQHFSQQDQLINERIKERVKEEEKTRLAQPIIEITRSYISNVEDSGKNWVSINIEIENNGAIAFHSRINLIQPNVKNGQYSFEISKIDRFESAKLTLNLEDFDYQAIKEIKLTYLDSLLRPQFIIYSIIIDKSEAPDPVDGFYKEGACYSCLVSEVTRSFQI